jgi:NO-binding membrane sensor protein with MHYT domain
MVGELLGKFFKMDNGVWSDHFVAMICLAQAAARSSSPATNGPFIPWT